MARSDGYRRYSVVLRPEVFRRLEALAEEHEVPISQLVRRALRAFLEAEERKEAKA